MNERRNLRFHLLRLTNLETENGLVVNRNTHMPVLANLGTPRKVLREKVPAALPQGLIFALQKCPVNEKSLISTTVTPTRATVLDVNFW